MTTEFDGVFDQMEAPEYPATCDKCGYEATNAEIDQHICNDAPAAPERGEHSPLPWSIEDGPSGYADESADSHYTIIAADSFSIAVMVNDCVPPERGNAELIVRAVNLHSTLIAQRERLLEAAKFALSTPGFIRGRDSLQQIVDEVLTTIEQEGTETAGHTCIDINNNPTGLPCEACRNER